MANTVTSINDYPMTPGRYLIEASAGTGKTYTIVELYKRLILEKKLRTKDILVVTFSKAATAELKERISAGLNKALREECFNPDGKPDIHKQLLLQLALASFDEAAISTIHSFCQKALSDFAVEAGESFAMSLVASNDEYTDKLIRDFWRQEFGTAEEPPAITMETLHQLAQKISVYSNTENKTVTPQDHFYVKFLEYLKDKLPKLKQDASVIQFEDLVIRLRDALRANASGGRLAARIRNRYKAVFVDEFQDTDAAQYEVFDKCFPKESNTIFYMIGDPKQAIYAFRGADIYAYLQAKNDVDPERQFTLTKNFRSAPELIKAVSEMFTDDVDKPEGTEFQHSFLQKGIPFVQVSSGRNAEDFLITENGVPIKNHFTTRFHLGSKTNLEPLIIQQTAREIASLLSEERNIRITKEQRPLKASDIAVLVQRHSQGVELQQELRRYNINAAANDKSNVFTSPEAEELETILRAIIEPDGNHIRSAMISGFYQLSFAAINEAVQTVQESPLESWKDSFRKFGEIWRTRGFAAMFTTLLDHVPQQVNEPPRLKILASSDGERAMTNYLHLMELLRRKEISSNFSPENTLDYLRNARVNGLSTSSADADKSTDPDASELRLDKDSDTVQIVTLFASKGLQYPIVFLPFPVSGPANKPHSSEVGYQTRDDKRTYFDFNEQTDARVLQQYREENLRTQLRLLYVALTRAEYLCYTDFMLLPEKAKANANNLAHSAAGALFLKKDNVTVEERLKNVFTLPKGIPTVNTALWFQRSTTYITTEHEPNLTGHAPGTLRQSDTEQVVELTALPKPAVSHAWRLMSYSSFHYGNHSSDGIRDLNDDEHYSGNENDEDANKKEKPIFQDFPRGKFTGTFVHNMLEHLAYPANGNSNKLTFADFAPGAQDEEKIRDFLHQQLEFQGMNTPIRLEQLREGLERLFTTPLTEDSFCLSEIDLKTALPELEFTMNIPDTITLKRLLAIIRKHGGEAMKILPDGYTFQYGINGLLNGVIDLLFLHNGKYYIADYKTNKLKSYSKNSVWTAMAECGYILQAYLYTMALYKLMKQRKKDFDFIRDFGGILYLFPKGMDRHGHGVWYHTPTEECIRELLTLTGNGAD